MVSGSIWLLDLQKYVAPSTCLHGFDISALGFPPEKWLPSNVSMRIWNAFEEPPASCIGAYDIVHVRLFLCAIAHNDCEPLLTNCVKLLSKKTCKLLLFGT